MRLPTLINVFLAFAGLALGWTWGSSSSGSLYSHETVTSFAVPSGGLDVVQSSSNSSHRAPLYRHPEAEIVDGEYIVVLRTTIEQHMNFIGWNLTATGHAMHILEVSDR
jgi:hypothetical protein